MARAVESRQLLYAYTSAHTTAMTDQAGVGVVLRTARRHTVRKASATAQTRDRVVAGYEAIKLALREARDMGARAVVVHTDNETIIRQLGRLAPIEAGHLARHLEVRSLLNQFHHSEVVGIPPASNEAAHELAIAAWEQRSEGDGVVAPELPLTWTGTG